MAQSKARKLPEPISEQDCAPSMCEACGAEFVCRATLKNCWCAEVELAEETRRILRERYARCLCRECLERFARDDEESEIR